MEDIFPLDDYCSQHGKDCCTDNAPDGNDGLHGLHVRRTASVCRVRAYVCGAPPSSIFEIRTIYRPQRRPTCLPVYERGDTTEELSANLNY
jgi:hypothetical protein